MRFFYITLVIAMASYSTEISGQTTNIYTLDNWRVSAQIDKETNKFSSCVAISDSSGGRKLLSEIDREWYWDIGFYARQWNYRNRENVPVRYRIDRGEWHNATALAMGSKLLRIPMPRQGLILAMFKQGKTLNLFDGQRYHTFSLRGTSKALGKLVFCVQRHLAQEQFEKLPKSGSETPGTSSGVSGTNAEVLRTESTRILSNFLSTVGLKGARMLLPSESKKTWGVDAVAEADKFIGVAHAFPAKAIYKSKTTISRLNSDFVRACIGKSTSDVSEESIDGVDVYSSYASCRLKGVKKVDQYLIVPRKNGGSYMIVLSTAHDIDPLAPTEQKYADSEISHEEFRRAAFLSSRSETGGAKLTYDRIPHLGR